MTVYVDEIRDYKDVKDFPAWKRKKWCHLLPDPNADVNDDRVQREFRSFAYRIGCQPGWEQRSQTGRIHFDLTPHMRNTAIRHGASEITTAEWGRRHIAWFQREMEGQ